jgi:hypothetical protein
MSQSTDIRNARTLKRAQAAYDDRAEPDEPESRISQQQIGDAEVEVDYCTFGGHVVVNGVWISGQFVEAHEFAQSRCNAWERRIRAELARDAA